MGSSFITVSRAFSALAVAFSLNVLAVPEARAAATTPPDQPVLIDTSSSAGGVFASSSSADAFPPANAFDGLWSASEHRWLAYINPSKSDYTGGKTGETPAYVIYRFNAPTKVNVLRLRIPNDWTWDQRAPKAWTFLGSNDGSTWTQLDARSGVTWTAGEVKDFSFENDTKYAYYKFNCTEISGTNDYMMLWEIQFLYDAGIVVPDLTTSTSGSVTEYSASAANYPGTKAFDDDKTNKLGLWISNSGSPWYVVYHFNTATAVNAISLYNGNNNVEGTAYGSAERSPKDWTFSGSNDGETWTVLDTQESETGWSDYGESRYYQFVNNVPYAYYKFNCTANNTTSSSDDANKIRLQLWEIELYHYTGPSLGAVSLARTGALAYSLTAGEASNAADLSYLLDNGTTVTTNGTQSVAEGSAANWTISGLTANKTWQVSVLAENANGTDEKVAGTLYSGELTLGAATAAYEDGLVAGGVTVSRAASDPYPLTVNYTISGSAGTEGTTWEAPVAVTIPANAMSAVLPVVPILDSSVMEDVTITVTLAAGNYEIPAAASATLALVNLAAPAGYNTWTAAADGLASVDSNWSAGHAPTSSENVLFDGRFSTANCEWDSAASATVASWTQTNGYTGTVTVDTVFPEKGGFTCLTISGDMTIASGSVTHRAHNATNKEDFYRLRIDVGGNLTVESGASIHATGKGAYGPHSGTGACAYGGSYDGSLAWGSLTEPYGVGSSPAADGTYKAPAGGAIWIEVAGATQINGSIRSDSVYSWGQWNGYCGSGGAVYLKMKTLSGMGHVSADCVNTASGSNNNSGAGGRVSILLTDGELDSFPNTNLTAVAGRSSYGRVGGTGTVLVRSPQKPNGVLYLCDRANKYGMYEYRPGPAELTRIPAGQTWILDEIVFGANAILQVPTGTTLNLPGGLASVSSTGNTLDETGLLVDGGTLVLPEAETHTISGKWIFQPTDFSLDGNLVVTNGAGVGTLLLYSTKSNEVRTCGLSVSSNMYVASNSSLRAVRGGYIATGSATLGGDTPGCHGGQSAGDASNCAYDSFFHPRHPGAFGADNGRVNVGGGAIRLAVGGTLTLDGIATATPNVAENRSGAAGSIDITAARLAGAGRIEANGNSRNYQATDSSKAGGGGRIAVRLTGEGENFSSDWLAKINAKGFCSSKITAEYSSSAGSIYLQDGSQAEGAGTIIIRNTGGADNNIAVTPIPSTKGGGENDKFSRATIALEEAARVRVFANLVANSLNMKAGTLLDLNGKKLVVGSAQLGGVLLEAGVYTQESEETEGFIADSVGGGVLFISGGGFQVHVR